MLKSTEVLARSRRIVQYYLKELPPQRAMDLLDRFQSELPKEDTDTIQVIKCVRDELSKANRVYSKMYPIP